MVSLVAVALVVGGAVLLFSGAALSIYGVGLLGFGIGASGGYLVAPTIGGLVGLEGLLALVAAAAIGGIVGLVVTYALLSMAIAAVSFVVGTFFGLVVVAPLVGGTGLLAYPVAIAVGIGAGFLGMVLTKTMMILITSLVGAALTSRSITVADFQAAQAGFSIDPLLFEFADPLFVGLLVLGILSQFGLFKLGYVAKLVALLPGASVFTDRNEEAAAD